MFFFPYSTDAPIYHWPIITVLMVAICIVAFYAEMVSPTEQIRPYILTFGNGLHPAQWITSNFLHIGIMHLAGNMLALWSFGLVVEGKLGWFRTLVIYLGIGMIGSAIVQCLMLGSQSGGGGLGASGIIFGIMAMSLIWAPENNMQCIFIFIIRPFHFEVSIMTMVALMLGLEILMQIRIGMAISSSAMHIIGAALGFGVAIAMLKARWVDCENWDAFSIWAGRNTSAGEKERIKQEEYEAARQQQEENRRVLRESALKEIHEIIQGGQALLALKAHQRMTRQLPDWNLPEHDLFNLIVALHKGKLWVESVPVMAEYAGKYPQNSPLVRLKLGQILVTVENRPAQALRVMAKVDAAALDARQGEILEKLRAKAEQMHMQDPYEIVEEW